MTIYNDLVVRGALMKVIKSSTAQHPSTGADQLEIQCRWPWTPDANEGGDKTYCFPDVEGLPWSNDRDAVGEYAVVIRRGYIKKNKDKQTFDGTHLWMWQWYVERFGEITEKEKIGDQRDYYGDRPAQITNTSGVSGGGSPEFNPMALGACANYAHEQITNGTFPFIGEGRDEYFAHFLYVRDCNYWLVNQVPPRPREEITGEVAEPPEESTVEVNIGPCPKHKGAEYQSMSDGTWAHSVRDGLCIWSMDGPVFRPNQPLEEPEGTGDFEPSMNFEGR
jgi:hypothetical protein